MIKAVSGLGWGEEVLRPQGHCCGQKQPETHLFSDAVVQPGKRNGASFQEKGGWGQELTQEQVGSEVFLYCCLESSSCSCLEAIPRQRRQGGETHGSGLFTNYLDQTGAVILSQLSSSGWPSGLTKCSSYTDGPHVHL